MPATPKVWTRLRRRPLWALVASVAGIVAVLGVCAGHRGGGTGGVPTAAALRGDLAIDLTSVGELQAVRSLSLGVPRLKSNVAKLVWLVPEGTTVAAGDTLARFDTNEVQRRIEDLDSRFTSARANLEKLRASQTARMAEMQAGIEDQRAGLRLAELDTANVSYEARVQQEKAQLALQRSRLNLVQAESKLAAQRTIDAAEITEQQVTISGCESQLRSEREALANHAVVAPTAGLAVYGTNWAAGRLAKIKVGDNLYYGGAVLELPDLSQMRVTSYVNEARVNQLRERLPCDVRVDAFPDTLYHGSLTRVNVLGRELQDAAGVKVFDFEVLMEGHDPRLRPGMTASVVVHVDQVKNVVYAPIETVHTDAQGSYVLRRKGRGFEPVRVTLGRQNDFHVVLASGVKPGDPLALRAPAEGADER